MSQKEFAEAIALGAAVGSAVYSALQERGDGALSDEEIAGISAAVAAQFKNSVTQAPDKPEDIPEAFVEDRQAEDANEPDGQQESVEADGQYDTPLEFDEFEDVDIFADAADVTDDLEDDVVEEALEEDVVDDTADPFVSFPTMPDHSMFPGAVTLSGSNSAFYEGLAAVDPDSDDRPPAELQAKFSGEQYAVDGNAPSYDPEELVIAEIGDDDDGMAEKPMPPAPPAPGFNLDIPELPDTVAEDVKDDDKADEGEEDMHVVETEPVTEEYTYVPPVNQVAESAAVEPASTSYSDIEDELMKELAAHKRSFDQFVQAHHKKASN